MRATLRGMNVVVDPVPFAPALVPAARLSPSYTLLDAFGDFTQPGRTPPTARQVGNALALAQALEMLRAVAGGRPLRIRCWASSHTPHPEGEGHPAGLGVDLIAPSGITDQALAHHAHALGFFRVVKLGDNLIHVEIGEGEQQPLTRVARNGVGPRAEQFGTGEVTRHTPTARMMQRTPIEAAQVLVRCGGAEAQIDLRRVDQLMQVWDAVDRLDARFADVRMLLVMAAVGLGLPETSSYFAFGPRWWQREISAGRRVPATLVSTAWNFCAPTQWGRIGPWQELRSTAIRDGFSPLDPWTTTQQMRATGTIDPATGQDAGEVVGIAQGALAHLDTAADYAARAMLRAWAETRDVMSALAAFYTDNGADEAQVAECTGRALGAVLVLNSIREARRLARED